MTTIDHTRDQLRSSGPMVQLTAADRRQRQQEVLGTPSRRYGLDAQLIFWLEDRAWGTDRTLSKFKARELVARAPYRAWARQHLEPHLDDEEANNERCHREVLTSLVDEDGVRENPIRFGLAPLVGLVGMFVFSQVQHRIDPRQSHRLNADIEDHATHEYAQLVDEHPEWEQVPYQPVVDGYGTYESRADVLRQICCDEGEHKARSVALANADHEGCTE